MLKFWELAPSPNNTKVRMALRFKEIDFSAIPVDPSDRAPVIEVSGQELTPVIEDRGIVLNNQYRVTFLMKTAEHSYELLDVTRV